VALTNVNTEERKDVAVELEGAEVRAEAGKLGGRAVRNYYSERPGIALSVALLGASSVIIGAILAGGLGLIVGVMISIVVAVLPPARKSHRDESDW